MAVIEDILAEYIRMRDYGLNVTEALQALKIYVETLTLDERQLLAQHLRSWESGKKLKIAGTPARKISTHGTTDTIWIACGNCDTKNRAIEVFCYKCGEMLYNISDKYDSKQFMQASGDQFNRSHFSQDSILILEAKGAETHFEIRPQLAKKEALLGRHPGTDDLSLDLEFDNARAAELGVSRSHLGIIFDQDNELLKVHDLGSANGSYINGQKLHPGEKFTLQHGDELRLGRLILDIQFLHPGEEL